MKVNTCPAGDQRHRVAPMSGSEGGDVRGKDFEGTDLTGARFRAVSFNGATFRSCELQHVVMRGVEIVDTRIDGEIQRLAVNGVDVAPLVEAELDRRHPDRVKFRPTTLAGLDRRGISTSDCGHRQLRARANCRPTCCTSRSTASGRSSRPCATSRSRPSPGSAAASWASPTRGTRCPCRGTRWSPGRECRTTEMCARRWRRRSPCGWPRWR